MKKLLFFVLTLFAVQAQAQIGQGLFAGGGLGITVESGKSEFGNLTIDGPTTTGYSFSPRVGYFFTDNIGAGLELMVSGVNTSLDDDKTTSSIVGVGVFGRYAIGLGEEEKFAIVGDLNIRYMSQTGETKTGNITVEDDPINTVAVGIAPSLLYFPTPKIGLEMGLGNIISYENQVEKVNGGDDKITSNTFELLNLNSLNLNISASYYFNR